MSKLLKIGIVGCGAIGSSLAEFIVKELSAQAKLSGLYDIDPSKERNLSDLVSKNRNLAVKNLKQLIAKSELIVEAASAVSSRDIARRCLNSGRDIMIMSAGGIAGHIWNCRAWQRKIMREFISPAALFPA